MADERRTSAARQSDGTPVADPRRERDTRESLDLLERLRLERLERLEIRKSIEAREAVAPPADVDLGPWGAPSAIRTPYYGRVREAWRAAVARHDYTAPPLAIALQVFARDARAREIPVSDLLKALDAMIDARSGGEYALDADHVRQWAGLLVTRAYYRDD